MAAMKIINKLDLLSGSREENEKSINQLLREIKIQSFMRHPNLIQLYDFFSDEINVYLLLELACDGHLYEFLMKKLFFTEETTSILAREIIAGVDYMHSQNIIHRDLKLENIVLSHVEMGLFRAWPRYAISVGRSIVPRTSVLRYAVLPFTCRRRLYRGRVIIRRWTSGPLGRLSMNSLRRTTRSILKRIAIWPRS
jgi:serine/threonine protein kinase